MLAEWCWFHRSFLKSKHLLCPEGEIGHVCMWMRYPVLAQTIADRGVDFLNKYQLILPRRSPQPFGTSLHTNRRRIAWESCWPVVCRVELQTLFRRLSDRSRTSWVSNSVLPAMSDKVFSVLSVWLRLLPEFQTVERHYSRAGDYYTYRLASCSTFHGKTSLHLHLRAPPIASMK